MQSEQFEEISDNSFDAALSRFAEPATSRVIGESMSVAPKPCQSEHGKGKEKEEEVVEQGLMYSIRTLQSNVSYSIVVK